MDNTRNQTTAVPPVSYRGVPVQEAETPPLSASLTNLLSRLYSADDRLSGIGGRLFSLDSPPKKSSIDTFPHANAMISAAHECLSVIEMHLTRIEAAL